jgi:hypothetical protein
MPARLRRHGPGDWFAVALALPAVIAARALIVIVPYRWWRSAIRPDSGGWGRGSSLLSPRRIAWAVPVAARFVPGATCLSQALAARTLLRLTGHPSTLTIGVRKGTAGELEAHAWVHSGAAPVVGVRAEGTYEVLRRGSSVPGAVSGQAAPRLPPRRPRSGG